MRRHDWRRRGDLLLRGIAAIPIGYGVASVSTMVMARLLPIPPAAATVTATLISFLLCAGAAMWSYAAPSGWRALWTLLVIGAFAGIVTWLSIAWSGRS